MLLKHCLPAQGRPQSRLDSTGDLKERGSSATEVTLLDVDSRFGRHAARRLPARRSARHPFRQSTPGGEPQGRTRSCRRPKQSDGCFSDAAGWCSDPVRGAAHAVGNIKPRSIANRRKNCPLTKAGAALRLPDFAVRPDNPQEPNLNEKQSCQDILPSITKPLLEASTMAKCSKCQQKISDADSQIGKCSHCGAAFPALPGTARPPFDSTSAGAEPSAPADRVEESTAAQRSAANVPGKAKIARPVASGRSVGNGHARF